MSQRKRLRTQTESYNSDLRQVFAIEKSPKPVIKGSKTTTIDDEKIYYESEPRGKDYKDSMLTLRDITNLMCPLRKYKIRHYGWNFAGLHNNQTPYGGTANGIFQTSSWSDYRRFSTLGLTSGNAEQMAYLHADTIAWTPGSQAWFESLSLPGTWDCNNYTAEDEIKTQPSMMGLIRAGHESLSHLNTYFNAHTNDKDNDYMIHYNGGSQLHTFVNQNEHEVYYEIWELIPRDIEYDWIRFMDSFPAGTYFQEFENIHTLVRYAYENNRPVNGSNANLSGVNNQGSFDTNLFDNVESGLNPDGQIRKHKNQLGFRINKDCLDVYHRFRVSKPVRGSIKSGGVLKYNLKHGPFKVLNSVWNRWVIHNNTTITNSLNPSDNLQPSKFGHLVPCATKILCVRFWSELGQKNNGFQYETTGFKFNFSDVSNVQGRLLHTVTENHAIRVIPYSKQLTTVEKSFIKEDFPSTDAQSNYWRTVNDESNTQATTLETN